jgi:hypothetical protein
MVPPFADSTRVHTASNRMEPALATMRLTPRAAAAVDEVLERANAGPNPVITAQLVDDVVTFRCDTYAPMLVARLDVAFTAELGPGWESDAQFVA